MTEPQVIALIAAVLLNGRTFHLADLDEGVRGTALIIAKALLREASEPEFLDDHS
jgi:hypothetical protein